MDFVLHIYCLETFFKEWPAPSKLRANQLVGRLYVNSLPQFTAPFLTNLFSFAEFPTCVAKNSAHAGSVILDCILSLDSGFIDDNSVSQGYQYLRVYKNVTFIRDSRFTHILKLSVGTNFLLNMALLDSHGAKFLRA